MVAGTLWPRLRDEISLSRRTCGEDRSGPFQTGALPRNPINDLKPPSINIQLGRRDHRWQRGLPWRSIAVTYAKGEKLPLRIAFVIGEYPPAERKLREDAAKRYETDEIKVGFLSVPLAPFNELLPAEQQQAAPYFQQVNIQAEEGTEIKNPGPSFKCSCQAQG